MKKYLCALLSGAAAVCLSGSVSAQVALPGSVEGPITSITDNGNGSVTMDVMGMTVVIPASAIQAGTIASPSKPLTLSEILDPTPLPGRAQAGWLGGTAKGAGTVSAAGIVTLDELIFEPAENVVVGVITGTQPLTVNHMPVELITDSRIPVETVNDLGFEIELSQATVGQGVAVEGYYASGTFRAFRVEVTGAPAKNPALQVTSLRAQGRPAKGELEIQGSLSGVTGALVPTVQFVSETGVVIGSVVVVIDPLVPGTASFRYRGRGLNPALVTPTVTMFVLDANGQRTAATSSTAVVLR